MSESGSAPIDINLPPRDRRHSILSDFLPESLTVPPSFIATSPIVREILTKDIAECSSEEDHGDDEASASDSDSESRQSAHGPDVKLAFHANGVSFGCGYSTIPVQGLDRPVPNPHEVDESYHAEVSLLRDNDIIPPRHPRKGWRISTFGRIYRYLFSTKVKDHEGPILPILTKGGPGETSPLLGATVEEYERVPPTPGVEEVYEQWEEAVAAHLIKTTWQRETKTLIQYSAPLIATFLLHYSVTIGSVLTVGRLGMLELAAVNRKSI